jgi:hypothetical protein
LGNHNCKNKERRNLNRRPIEQRSEKVCTTIIQELFGEEVNLIRNILYDFDYSKIDICLENGLKLVFEEIDDCCLKNLKSSLKQSNIHYKFNKINQELMIYK